MKKRSFLIIFFASIFLCSLTLFVGCSTKNKLQTPKLFEPDENNVLAWTEVDYSRGYRVRIEPEKGETKVYLTEKASYSLDNLDEGNYYVSVCAVGNKRDKLDSDWSEKLIFKKEYSTGLIYKLIENDTAYSVTGVGKAVGDVVIDDYYRGKPVLSIGERAFKDSKKVTSVKVGKNVSVINDGAFYGCSSLKSIELPEDLMYIGESAFQSCVELVSIKIPCSVSAIYSDTFAYCRALEKVEFLTQKTDLSDGSVNVEGTSTIGENAFLSCSSLSEIILPESLTGIGSAAFSQLSALTEINIPASVTYINSGAFQGDVLLKDVNFGEDSNLDFIGKSAFSGCKAIEKIVLPVGLTEISANTFLNCTSLADITIPDSVEEVGKYAFYGTKAYNDQLGDQEQTQNRYIYIDKWLVEYKKASDGLFNVTYLDLKPGTVGISSECFMGMDVEEVILPNSLKYISSYAFYQCTKLKRLATEDHFDVNKDSRRITLKETASNDSELRVIGSTSFAKCALLTEIYLPSKLQRIGSYAFYQCEKLDLVGGQDVKNRIPQSVTTIGTQAFRLTAMWVNAGFEKEGNGLLVIPMVKSNESWLVDYNLYKEDLSGNAGFITEVNIKTLRIKHIANYALAQLATLAKVNDSNELASIGTGAFYKCTFLTSFTYSRGLKEIKPYTFYGCKALSGIKTNDVGYQDLESIGAYAFFDCEVLTSFTLNRTKVTSIAPYSFAFCVDLKSFEFENSKVTSIGSYAFYADISLGALTLPDTVEVIGPSAFFQCESLAGVDFGEGLKRIYNSAFYGCDQLNGLNFPKSLVYIGSSAFYKCRSLSDISFETGYEEVDGQMVETGINYIGNYAFFNVEKLDYVGIPSTVKNIGKYAFRGIFGASSVTIGDNLEKLGAHAFYALDNLTIYTELTEKPIGWSGKWNSLQRPVIWGVTLDETGMYVKSLTVTENTFEYTDYRSISAPRKAGAYFLYWSLSENGEKAYSETEVVNAPVGTVLYAVWQEEVADWIIERDAQGRIVYIVVGSGEMPEELKIEGETQDSSSSSGDIFDSASDSDYLTLYGWAYKRGGYAEFLKGAVKNENIDEKIKTLKPGTKLFAVYYDTQSYTAAVSEYNKRVDPRYVRDNIAPDDFWNNVIFG